MSEIDELETKEFMINWQGKEESVIIRRLSWREELNLRKKWASVKRAGNNIDFDVDWEKKALLTAATCIKVAPFFKPGDTLDKKLRVLGSDSFPNDVGVKIEEEISDFHNFEKKSENTSKLGNGEQKTQQ